jgi:hypothetical protein
MLAVPAACELPGDDDDTPTAPTTGATAPTTPVVAAPQGDLRLVSLSMLDGEACPALTNRCQVPDRVAMVVHLVEEANCPQVVALQDTAPWIWSEFEAHLATWCGGRYTPVGNPVEAVDRPLVFTSLSAPDHELVPLAGGRTALWTRLEDGGGGRIHLVVTRVGGGGDALGAGGVMCGSAPGAECPSPCSASGTLLDCQIVQLGALVESRRDLDSTMAVIAADLSVSHDAPVLNATFWSRGWRDAFLDAGNAECDPEFNIGCTAGRVASEDELPTTLSSPGGYNAVGDVRPDYILVSPSLACSPRFDAASDTDADGLGTGLWAHRPSDPLLFNNLIWPSDHVGLAVDVSCI